MPEYSDDSDEELGAYIYSTSRTAKLLREQAAARKNNGLTTDTRTKRKIPHEVENISVSSEPTQRSKKRRKKCSNKGCNNQVQNGGVCIRHGASWTKKTCSHKGCTNYAQKGGVCVKHGAKVKICSDSKIRWHKARTRLKYSNECCLITILASKKMHRTNDV